MARLGRSEDAEQATETLLGLYPGLTPVMLDYVVDMIHAFCGGTAYG